DPSFFPFCEAVLAEYRDDPTVMHVGASNFQPPGRRHDASYYFSWYGHNWGWATWRDAWQRNDTSLGSVSAAQVEARLAEMFARRRDRRHWQLMFRYAKSGKVDTWDYSWAFSMWANGGRAVTPSTNLASNLGFGLGSTHTHDPTSRWAAMPTEPVTTPLRHPAGRDVDAAADEWTSDEFYGITRKAATGFVKIRLAIWMPVRARRALKRWRAAVTARAKNPGG
ncbi:MAG TPA: hypothetical protein VD926_01230, partial [Acidimicrobiales bacterium]|nr:hypothetical protein [Acidimicrobiales bacterium]